MTDGWNESAAGWLAAVGETGDWSRTAVLDGPMLARVKAGAYRRALDVGCGEGRFCRMLRALQIDAVGVEPTVALREEAQRRDPGGTYVEARGEALPFSSDAFDLVVSYLTLIDIADYRAALAEMTRVLAPGGALLIANLNGFITAGAPKPLGWVKDQDGRRLHFAFDNYLEERGEWAAWGDIRILNWHRPFSAYVATLLELGLTLAYFDEPPAESGSPADIEEQRRAPLFHIMEWRKARA